jgi:hypothetical protein
LEVLGVQTPRPHFLASLRWRLRVFASFKKESSYGHASDSEE